MLILGGLYAVLSVGVPSQDPTPEMIRRETMHLDIAGWIMTMGAGLLVCGIFATLLTVVLRAVNMGSRDL